jgi:hypothetical protein
METRRRPRAASLTPHLVMFGRTKQATIAYLRTGSHAPGQTASVKDRIQHRAKHYYFENNLLRKQMPAGVDKINHKFMPEPHLRANLIRATHLDTGHFGIKKTYSLLEPEHFTKWVELVSIPEKSSFCTAAALKGVLTRFGAPAEVLTDQGEEFQGEFAVLLQKLLIDHRTTSRDHPRVHLPGHLKVLLPHHVVHSFLYLCFLCFGTIDYLAAHSARHILLTSKQMNNRATLIDY